MLSYPQFFSYVYRRVNYGRDYDERLHFRMVTKWYYNQYKRNYPLDADEFMQVINMCVDDIVRGHLAFDIGMPM